jgi:tRNA-dihydrouridine synthase
VAIAPFITTKKGCKLKRKHVKDVLPENNTGPPVIPQILSKAPGDFIILANYLFDLGYRTVNWNLGCPYPMVANKKRGSGMLPHKEMIQEFLDRVVPGLHGGLSIKVRLGWRTKEDIFNLIPVLNQYPLTEIIVHPRTGLQRYQGEVDLEAFRDCMALIRHPVVYNGDIRTCADFTRLSQQFADLNRWMIGRGCIANPFLPALIKNGKDDIQDKLYTLRQFHESLFFAYADVLDGPSHLLNKMKGLWKYFYLVFKDCPKAMKKIKKATRPDHYLDRVNHFFETEAELFS